MANYVQGSLINVFYHDGTAWKTFAYAQSNSLNNSNETTNVSSKDHGLNPDVTISSSSFGFSGEYFFTPNTAEIAQDMFDKAKPYTFAFGQVAETDYASGLQPVTNKGEQQQWTPGATGKFIRYGNAILTSFNVTANNGEIATCQIEATGSGGLTKTAPSTINSYEA